MPSEKRSAEAETDIRRGAEKKRRGDVSSLDDDALSLSLKSLLCRPIANKDIRAVVAAHNSHGKLRVEAFCENNKEAVLKTLLSLASDRDSDGPDRELAFDLLQEHFSGDERVFEAAFRVMTAATGFSCDGDKNPIQSVKTAAFLCAEANTSMFADRVAPILDQLESADLQGAQEALRIVSSYVDAYEDFTILTRDLEEAAQATARRFVNSTQPGQQVDGIEFLFRLQYIGGDFGAEEEVITKRIASLFTTSINTRVTIMACECTTHWSVLDELNKVEPGIGFFRAVFDKLAAAQDKAVAEVIMSRLTYFLENTMDDYLEGMGGAEAIQKKIVELVESRGVDLVLGWTKAKPLVPVCLTLLSHFCTGTPSTAQVSDCS
jgi:hypothetical protein